MPLNMMEIASVWASVELEHGFARPYHALEDRGFAAFNDSVFGSVDIKIYERMAHCRLAHDKNLARLHLSFVKSAQ